MKRSKALKVLSGVLMVCVLVVSAKQAQADITFRGFATGAGNPGVSRGDWSSDFGVDSVDSFTSSGWGPWSGYHNGSVTSQIEAHPYWFDSSATVIAKSAITVAPSTVLSTTPVVLATYSYYDYVLNPHSSTYGLFASSYSELAFGFGGTGDVYWGVKWDVAGSGDTQASLILKHKPGLNIPGLTGSGVVYGHSLVNDYDPLLVFNSEAVVGGKNGTIDGTVQFAFASQPFNTFPVVPEPTTLLLLSSGIAGLGLIKKNKRSDTNE